MNASMTLNSPKTWAWASGILGIMLVVCGFLSQTPRGDDKDGYSASPFTWVSVVVGVIMLLAGFMTLMKLGKGGNLSKSGVMNKVDLSAENPAASVSDGLNPDSAGSSAV